VKLVSHCIGKYSLKEFGNVVLQKIVWPTKEEVPEGCKNCNRRGILRFELLTPFYCHQIREEKRGTACGT
jgi:hypothetical protein